MTSTQIRPASYEDDTRKSSEPAQLREQALDISAALEQFLTQELPGLNDGMIDGTVKPLEYEQELLAFLTKLDLNRLTRESAGLSPKEETELMLLDLIMIEQSMENFNLERPAELQQAVNVLADQLGVPPGLSYELIIHVNPEENIRTFRGGAARDAEKIFYTAHMRVEEVMAPGLEALKQALEAIDSGDLDRQARREVNANLLKARKAQGNATKTMAKNFKSFKPDDFSQFREFLCGTRSQPGPSGLYSGSIQSFRLLALGKCFADRGPLVRAEMAFFPPRDKEDLGQALERSDQEKSLLDHVKNGDLLNSTKIAAGLLFRSMKTDLTAHFSLVKRILPEAFGNPEALGTAGKPIEEFLKEAPKSIEEASKSVGL